MDEYMGPLALQSHTSENKCCELSMFCFYHFGNDYTMNLFCLLPSGFSSLNSDLIKFSFSLCIFKAGKNIFRLKML